MKLRAGDKTISMGDHNKIYVCNDDHTAEINVTTASQSAASLHSLLCATACLQEGGTMFHKQSGQQPNFRAEWRESNKLYWTTVLIIYKCNKRECLPSTPVEETEQKLAEM